MNKRLQYQKEGGDAVILFVTGGLLLIGLTYLASALTGRISALNSVISPKFLEQLILGVGAGSIIAYILARTNYRTLFLYAKPAMWFVVLLLLSIAIPVIFVTIIARIQGLSVDDALRSLSAGTGDILHYANNSIRWIKIGFSIQPSEVAKLVLLLYLASIVDKSKELNLKKTTSDLVLILITLAAILVQPDLGNVVVILIILGAGLWVAGVRVRIFAGLVVIMSILAFIFALTTSYRNSRITTWAYQNFCSHYDLRNLPPKNEREGICSFFDFSPTTLDSAYQSDQIRQAFARGGIAGVGYNKGNLKVIIPEVFTDGIIGVIGEESGFIMVAIVCILYLVLFLRGIRIAENAPDTAGKVLASGISVWIIFQAFWNITGMTGLVPMKGLTLPFISDGNSSMIVTLAAIGILYNISKQSKGSTKLVQKRVINYTQRPLRSFYRY